MRNKESFLKELQSRLAVLEEAEQQDILAEYAQHIDLRVESGLTEEAAIQDFGDMDQLAAEILGAYHVKATYQEPKKQPRWSFPDLRPALRRGAAGVGAFFRRLGGGIAGSFRKLKERIGPLFSRCRKWLNKPLFARPGTEEAEQEAQDFTEPVETEAPQEMAEHTEKREAEMAVERGEKRRAAWAALGRGFRRLGGGIWRLCRGTAWLVWNLFLLLCSLPFVCLGLLALVCLGALAVLLIQGYPLAGIALCCLGGAACCVGVLGLGSGLVWHRAGPAVSAAAAEETALAVAETEREEMTADDAE